jgi:hypothetical protein
VNRGAEKLAAATRRDPLGDLWERLAAADWERVERMTQEAQQPGDGGPKRGRPPVLTPEERKERRQARRRAWEAANRDRELVRKREERQRKRQAERQVQALANRTGG